MNKTVELSLAGRTMRWRFEDGPTANALYEHEFGDDGTVTFRQIKDEKAAQKKGAARPHHTPKAEYASSEIAPGIHLVSYLSNSGYTLTCAVNLSTNEITAFASNEKEWYPVHGTIES